MSLMDAMSGLMSGGIEDYASQAVPQNTGMQRQMGSLRAMRYLRPNMSRMASGRMPPSRQESPMNFAQGGPDYAQQAGDPAYQAAASQLLAPYGLHPLDPAAANPFVMFPNSGFAPNHPGLAHAIEGGVLGAATTQGSDTWGEGISNVAQSLLRVPQLRNQMLGQQFQAPFQQASQMQGLKNQQLQGQSLQTMMDYHRAQIDHLNRPTITPEEKANMTRPVVLPDGTYLTPDAEMGWTPHGEPMRDPDAGKSGQRWPDAASQRLAREAGFTDPSQLSSKDWGKINRRISNDAIGKSTATAAGTEAARLNVKHELPGQENAPESPQVKQVREDYKRDYSQFDTEGYADKVANDIMQTNIKNKSAQPMATDEQVRSEISKRKVARQAQFNQDLQKAKQPPANPMGSAQQHVKYNQADGTLY